MEKVISKSTILFYFLIAAFPLMRANINSLLIIICCLFTLHDFLKNKKKVTFSKKIIYATLVFWLFLFYEIISLNFSSKIILRHLPFLIFPLLFIYKPNYINEKVKNSSIFIFQSSVILQCLIYLYVFIKEYSLQQIFSINNYNIPLFRTFVHYNTSIEIHPTYFSSFLLCSFTISLFFGLKNSVKKNRIFHITNIFFTLFFILVFVSKIIILVLVLTILVYLFILLKNKKDFIKKLIVILILSVISFFSFKNLITSRFNEIKTEINRPLVGDYHNSINIRVAIMKCSYELLKKVPFFGFGNNLQEELNNCYENNYDSNFHKLATYNSHNYYINLILYGGWIFFFFFLLYLFFLFKQNKFPLFIIVILTQLVLINFTENFFSRHHGIILFIYFISLFLSVDKHKQFIK